MTFTAHIKMIMFCSVTYLALVVCNVLTFLHFENKLEAFQQETRTIHVTEYKLHKNTLDIINNHQETLDILDGRAEILENSVHKKDHIEAQVDMTVSAIKQTLPLEDNPHKGCRAKPTQGEIRRIAHTIVTYSNKHKISPALVLAIMRQESIFCNTAVSHAGAQGYMQIMPDTAVEIAADIGMSLKIWRERDNIHMGIIYIGTLLAMFNGDVNLAIRAYNSGPHHVNWVQAGRSDEVICNDGMVTKYYCETEKYARLVLKYKEQYQKLGLL